MINQSLYSKILGLALFCSLNISSINAKIPNDWNPFSATTRDGDVMVTCEISNKTLLGSMLFTLFVYELFDTPGFFMEKIGKLFGLVKNIPQNELKEIHDTLQKVSINPDDIKAFKTYLPSWYAFPTGKRFFLNTEKLEELSGEEKEFYIAQQAQQVSRKHFLKTKLLKDVALWGLFILTLESHANDSNKNISKIIKQWAPSALAFFAVEHLAARYWRSLNKTADIKTIRTLGWKGAMSYLKNHARLDENDFLHKLGKIFIPTYCWRETSAKNRIENIAQEIDLV